MVGGHLRTEDDVLRLLLRLDNSKSTNEFSAKMLKGIYHFQYCSQFDKAFQPQTCSFPKLWKCARIVPIPKKGDLSLPENYHPITQFYHS